MKKLSKLTDKIEKGSYITAVLESKNPELFDENKKPIKYYENLLVSFDCTVKDLAEMFLDHFFEKGEVDLTLVEKDDFEDLKVTDFKDIKHYANFKYFWASVQDI